MVGGGTKATFEAASLGRIKVEESAGNLASLVDCRMMRHLKLFVKSNEQKKGTNSIHERGSTSSRKTALCPGCQCNVWRAPHLSKSHFWTLASQTNLGGDYPGQIPHLEHARSKKPLIYIEPKKAPLKDNYYLKRIYKHIMRSTIYFSNEYWQYVHCRQRRVVVIRICKAQNVTYLRGSDDVG